jgi:hypothetical protein
MPKGSLTTLFVSSTCYDLAQIRADLRDFASTLGLEPILSEFATFPVDPSRSTLENCLQTVRARADIFLLVVGNRYGSLGEAGRSITNLEYAEAEARSIPRYVFVKSEILSLLPIWKSNPTADFSSSVDSPKLFEFVAHLRESGSVWVFPFNSAQDIASTLRTQISYLLADCLELRGRLYPDKASSLRLGPESLRIYLERPLGWEYLVFAKILQERMSAHRQKRLDIELGLPTAELRQFSDIPEALNWAANKFPQLSHIISGISKAMGSAIAKAVGEPGQPGDIERIEHLATRIAEVYERILDWTLEFHSLDVDPVLERFMSLASQLSSNALREIEEFSDSLFGRIKHALDHHKPGDSVEFTLVLTVPDISEFEAEMQRVRTAL